MRAICKITLLGLTLFLAGCAGKIQTTNELSYEEKFNKAQKLFNAGKYDQALEILSQLKLSPSIWADDAYLLSAKIHLKKKDYDNAIIELNGLISQYRHSELVEEARFLLAEAYRLRSPRAELDQTYTNNAINFYNQFLELYPFSCFADSAKAGLSKCYEKLAKKLYLNALLYYKSKHDSAAIVYINQIKNDENYSKTIWRYWAELLLAKIYYRNKKFDKALSIINSIASSTDDKRLLKKVYALKNKIENR